MCIRDNSRGVQYAVTAFFALNPIWGVFIQTQVKDTLYTGLFVLFVLKTADLLPVSYTHLAGRLPFCDGRQPQQFHRQPRFPRGLRGRT